MVDLPDPLQNPWKFACGWYSQDDVFRGIQNSGDNRFGALQPIPRDIYSRDFAVWMTDQYRLAMTKGIEIAKQNYKDELDALRKRCEQLERLACEGVHVELDASGSGKWRVVEANREFVGKGCVSKQAAIDAAIKHMEANQ